MMSFGTPAGANRPLKFAATMPGSPASIAVGMSGAACSRLFAATARMRTLPVRWNCSSGPPTFGVIIGMWPRGEIGDAGAAPL